MVTAREMGKSLGHYVKAYCKDGEVVEGVVKNYVKPEDNYPYEVAQIEVEREKFFIILKQYEVDKIEIFDIKTGFRVTTEPTKWEKLRYFLLGKDINK